VPADPPNRKKILQAALHCVALYGPDRLSMAGVAETAGVSRGTVYKYFANSDALIGALAEYVRDRFQAGVIAAMHTEGDTRQKLVNIIDGRMDAETRDAVMRLRQLQPSFTLNFLTTHTPDFVQVYEDALRDEFEEGNLPLGLHEFAEILCRVVMAETLLMDDHAHTQKLVLTLWDAISANRSVANVTPARSSPNGRSGAPTPRRPR
jgi:AcrR family transcriptional regulator